MTQLVNTENIKVDTPSIGKVVEVNFNNQNLGIGANNTIYGNGVTTPQLLQDLMGNSGLYRFGLRPS